MRWLAEYANRLGVSLDDAAIERFTQYRELLIAANARFNLTRITDPDEIELRLFADSLSLLPHFPDKPRRLLDIGSGGGIPGIAMAIATPSLPITLLDATAKKVRFLEETVDALGLDMVTAIHGRAEELARSGDHRERYDVVTARAVARLVTLAELTIPFLRVGGRAILPKGSAAAEELAEARYAIGLLGGKASAPVETALEGTTLIVIDKRRATPATHPRSAGLPHKLPLLG